ncbi:hypothetical protein N3936_33825, partial [Bacillus thuringiensis]|nr:hypothetical protein [Bacillus thuringiensis]
REDYSLYSEIEHDEKWHIEGEFVIAYQGKSYLKIANVPDEEHAMTAIRSYWRASKDIRKLYDFEQNKKNPTEEHDN